MDGIVVQLTDSTMPYHRVYSRKYMPECHCSDALMTLNIMEGWQRVDLVLTGHVAHQVAKQLEC